MANRWIDPPRHGVVGAAIERFRDRPEWVLAISPRARGAASRQWEECATTVWPTVPGVLILPVAIDRRRRVIETGTLFRANRRRQRWHGRTPSRFTAEMARLPGAFATES
ncbi:MAG: hypothetical protein IPO52_04070 [Gemmatimonadetes bacterium]|nr:hypothetical protein [Gemmatimonadota bacterium]